MNEQGYQTKIMKEWEQDGGHNVNGNYTKAGEADLQGGYPYTYIYLTTDDSGSPFGVEPTKRTRLLYLAVEVKTEIAYKRVMSCLEEIDGLYVINNIQKLKPHESLQVAKINLVRKKGGLALFAWNYEQVKEYVNGNAK